MKRFLAMVLGLSLTVSTVSAFAGEGAATLEEKAQSAANELVNTYGITSVQFSLMDNSEVILSGSAGLYSKEGDIPVESGNMYGIGSVSKVYVTAAVMKLADENKVDIDLPLTTYIPEFKMADERYKLITPRMLMNHSSGIYGTHFVNAFLFNDSDTKGHDTLLSELAKQGLRAAPGEMSEYCNDGFTLLEILTERVSAMTYSEFLEENFSKPLGLERTKTAFDDFDRELLAQNYVPMFDGALPADSTNILGAGGLYSSAYDMCKYAEVFMGKRPDILSEEAAAEMQNAEYKKGVWVNDGGENLFAYGLGWDSVNLWPFSEYGIKALLKGGDTGLYHSILVAIPEYNISMAVSSSGGVSLFNYAFASDILLSYLEEKGIIDEVKPIRTFEAPVKAVMPENLRDYSGTYVNASEQKNIEIKDGEVDMPSLSGIIAPQTYVYTEDAAFVSQDGSARLDFYKIDDRAYLQAKIFVTLPGVGQFAYTYFDSQKSQDEDSSFAADISETWKNREGGKYYVVSEKAASQAYFIGGIFFKLELNTDFSNGYIHGGTKIFDENSAYNTLKYFRDVTDIEFFEQDDTEYALSRGGVFINEKDMPDIGESGASYIIGEDGYSKYYNTGSAAGSTITVTLPDGGAYAVYDANDVCVNFTVVSQNNSTVLPENGKIMFAGEAGDVFKIDIQK